MINFFDADGQPIDLETFGRLFADLTYRVLAETRGRGADAYLIIRTVWSGVDDGTILPFSTGVAHVVDGPWKELEQYPTREAALCGHHDWVTQLITDTGRG